VLRCDAIPSCTICRITCVRTVRPSCRQSGHLDRRRCGNDAHQGSCRFLVSSLTWVRTCVIACRISTPGCVILAISARVNGLLVPTWPSSAVCLGPVANAIRLPAPDFISARPVCTEALRTLAPALIFAAKGLSRQASRNTSLTLAAFMVWSSVRSTLIALPSLTSISNLMSASTALAVSAPTRIPMTDNANRATAASLDLLLLQSRP
jgi:hypothetical protein